MSMANEVATCGLYDDPAGQLAAVERIGEVFAKSGMFGCTKTEQGMVLAMACMSERLNPIELKKKYHLIDGQLSMRTDSMLGEFKARGGKVKWLCFDAQKAEAEFTIDGNTITISYTIEDAQKARHGQWNGKAFNPGTNWAKSPDAMLRARLVSKAVRMLAPEAISGTYTPEEIEDFHNPAPAAEKPLFKSAAAPAPVEVQATVVETEPDTEESIEYRLVKAIGGADQTAKTVTYLETIDWLRTGQALGHLPRHKMEQIIARADAFCAARDKKISEMHKEVANEF
jgi:hypothetical protein